MASAPAIPSPASENTGLRLVYTVEEVAKIFGICRNTAYDRVASGEIPSIRIGRRLVVPKLAIDKMLAG